MARPSTNTGEQQVRLGFQLFASDNPLLVADLLKLRKGKLRHARLVTLATIGLLVESRFTSANDTSSVPALDQHRTDGRRDDAGQISPMTDEEFVDVN
jgi:hypothetical protein